MVVCGVMFCQKVAVGYRPWGHALQRLLDTPEHNPSTRLLKNSRATKSNTYACDILARQT
jgi:hypothetical protein